jgi:Fe-S cluster assembly protein SufB
VAEEKLNKIDEDEVLDAIVSSPYKYGFTTNLETEEFEKGLNEEVVKKN